MEAQLGEPENREGNTALCVGTEHEQHRAHALTTSQRSQLQMDATAAGP